MTDEMGRMLAEAAASRERVLIDPTADEIRRKAESLRLEGKLACTFCRKPIGDEPFETRRIVFGTRLEAVAHLHAACGPAFAAALEERVEPQKR